MNATLSHVACPVETFSTVCQCDNCVGYIEVSLHVVVVVQQPSPRQVVGEAPPVNSELQVMIAQVQEVLPNVPLQTITTDLGAFGFAIRSENSVVRVLGSGICMMLFFP